MNKICIGPGALIETTLNPSVVVVTYRHDGAMRCVYVRIEVDVENGGAISRAIGMRELEYGNHDLVRMYAEQAIRSLEKHIGLESPPYNPPVTIATDINGNPFVWME